MPFSFKPYEPPPLSNIRERSLNKLLERVDTHIADREAALQEGIQRGLSPVFVDVNRQELNSIRDFSVNLRNKLEFIEQQNAAERKTELALADDTPLDRSRTRYGLFRSSNERNLAILGILERERRQNAPLTRAAFERAKAIAASRKYYDPETSQLRGSRGTAYSPSDSDLVRSGFDPCIDRKRVRREVMFAQESAGIGYRGKGRRRWPC